MDMKRVQPSEQERAEELCRLLSELREKGQDDALTTLLERRMESQKKAS